MYDYGVFWERNWFTDGLKNICNLVNFWLISKVFWIFSLEKYLKTGDDKFTFTGRFILLFFVSSIFSLSITQIKFVRFFPFENYEIILNSRIFLTTVFFFKFFKQIYKNDDVASFLFLSETLQFLFLKGEIRIYLTLSQKGTLECMSFFGW